MPSLVQLDYVLMAFSLLAVMLAAYGFAIGKRGIRTMLGIRGRYVVASPRDRRLEGAALGLLAIGALANAVGLGIAGGHSGQAIQYVQIGVFLLSLICVSTCTVIRGAGVRYLDRRDGRIATSWERFKR